MNSPNYPSPKVKAFGERLMSELMNARIRTALGGFGGCKDFDLSDFDIELRPYIQAYLEEGVNSLAITYAAMRTKEIAENLE